MVDVIRTDLLEKGVLAKDINMNYVLVSIQARLNFLRDFANIRYGKVSDLAVAEVGYFKDSTLKT